MKKEVSLITAIIGIIIVLFVVIYKLLIANRVVSDNVLIIILGIFVLFTIVFIISMTKIYIKEYIKPEKVLLIIMPIFCILLSIAIPVGRGHDEFMHWYKAFEISQGQIVTPIDKENRVSRSKFPDGVQKIIVERNKGIFKYVDNIPLLQEKINHDRKILVGNQNSTAYCFVQYIPEVIGILIGKSITQIPILIAYCSRLVNMICCIVIMYFAVKKIPFGKNILLLLSVIPITIEGFTTISPDGLTIAVSALFISYTFYVAFDKNKVCGTKETIILTIIGTIVSLCKIVYMPLIFLVLIIPKEKFNSKKNKIVSMTIILSVGIILNFLWLVYGCIALLNTNTNTYVGTDQNGTLIKLTTLLSNPMLYIQKMFYTFGLNFNKYFLSLFGGQLEWNETIKIDIIPYMIFIIAMIATFSDEKLKIKFNKFQKIVMMLVIIIITILIFTSLYIQWSDNELTYIDGVQGRYFIPLLPLMLFLIAGLKIKTSYKNQDVTKLICISSFIIQLYTIASVVAEHI